MRIMLIGKQNIHDIPDRTKIVWLKQTIGTAVRMIFFPADSHPRLVSAMFFGIVCPGAG